jgi:hypothetical protein
MASPGLIGGSTGGSKAKTPIETEVKMTAVATTVVAKTKNCIEEDLYRDIAMQRTVSTRAGEYK